MAETSSAICSNTMPPVMLATGQQQREDQNENPQKSVARCECHHSPTEQDGEEQHRHDYFQGGNPEGGIDASNAFACLPLCTGAPVVFLRVSLWVRRF